MRRLFLAASLIAICALASCPGETPESLAQAAAEQHRAHQYGRAAELYRRSLELHPDAIVRANLARALAADGKYGEAADQYAQLLQADISNGALWHDYGLVLETGIKDLPAAEEALFNATKYPPRLPEASFDLGRVLMERGRYEEAGACFEAAITAASPGSPWLDEAREKQVQAFLLAKQPR